MGDMTIGSAVPPTAPANADQQLALGPAATPPSLLPRGMRRNGRFAGPRHALRTSAEDVQPRASATGGVDQGLAGGLPYGIRKNGRIVRHSLGPLHAAHSGVDAVQFRGIRKNGFDVEAPV